MPEHEQPVAIITGAGSGVGRALAVQLCRLGYRCVLAGRTAATLEATAALVRASDPNCAALAVPTDITDAASVRALVDAAVEAYGRIDALANVAGYAPLQPIDQVEDATLADCTAINFHGVVHTIRACWPTFKQQKHGVIVNVSSMASIDPFPGFNIYGATKAAVNLLTKATADEGHPVGIKAYSIAPGAIETQMLRAMFDEKMLPKDKTLSPEQVAEAIADCITGETTMASGETFVLASP
ncbi:SDR family NAD(P)-dependent oxidoreductase [Phycisphaeraceae bacterium D3-23]